MVVYDRASRNRSCQNFSVVHSWTLRPKLRALKCVERCRDEEWK